MPIYQRNSKTKKLGSLLTFDSLMNYCIVLPSFLSVLSVHLRFPCRFLARVFRFFLLFIFSLSLSLSRLHIFRLTFFSFFLSLFLSFCSYPIYQFVELCIYIPSPRFTHSLLHPHPQNYFPFFSLLSRIFHTFPCTLSFSTLSALPPAFFLHPFLPFPLFVKREKEEEKILPPRNPFRRDD